MRLSAWSFMIFSMFQVKSLSEEEVNQLLLSLDDTIEIENVSLCLKKGIADHLIEIDPEKGLDTLLLKARCDDCGTKLKCTIRTVLYQPDIGEDIGGPVENEVGENEECYCGNYVTALCQGDPYLESGRSHHHCKDCPGLEKCIGQPRQGHCKNCNEHYYWGKSHERECPKCQESESE